MCFVRSVLVSNRLSSFVLLASLVSAVLVASLATSGCGPSDSLQQVREQQQRGDFEDSIEPLRELLTERRDDAEIQYLYGRALAGTGQFGLAEWSLRAAMEDPDWLVPAAWQLALVTVRAGNFASAIDAVDRVLASDPDNVAFLMLRAEAYTRSNLDHEKALADTERILELEPDHLQAMKPRILALLSLERTEEAAAAIEELGRRIEEGEAGVGTPAWHCATSALFTQEGGESERAAELWARCLEGYPSDANVVRNAVDFYDARGERGRSLEVLRMAVVDDPGTRQYRVRLAERLRQLGKALEARDVLRDATASDDPAAASAAWLDLGKHYQDVADWGSAAQAIGRSLELSRSVGSPSPQLVFEYADALLLAGDFERALETAEALASAGQRWMIRARVAQERGDALQALEHFEQAFQLWPDNPWARYYAARAAEAIGDFDRAVESYRYSIRIDPGATDARERVAGLHLAEGRPLEAASVLRVAADRAPLDVEGQLLALRVSAQIGGAEAVRSSLERFRSQAPGLLGRAAVQVAKGLRARAGPAAALRMLRQAESEGLDLTDPLHADALRALVRASHEAGQPEGAQATVRAALRKHPEVAAAHAAEGLRLELAGAPDAAARAAYERALELGPGDAEVLAALGRLLLRQSAQSELGGESERALSLLDRAARANPLDADPMREAARAVAARGRPEAAEERLEVLLAMHPYDAGAAALLAELQLERGAPTDRALELAGRSLRFGGGVDALNLLSRIHEQRNEPELATEAAARARALAERSRARREPGPRAGGEGSDRS